MRLIYRARVKARQPMHIITGTAFTWARRPEGVIREERIRPRQPSPPPPPKLPIHAELRSFVRDQARTTEEDVAASVKRLNDRWQRATLLSGSRLPRKKQLGILRAALRDIARWRRDEMTRAVRPLLDQVASVRMNKTAPLPTLLLRTAMPELDAKRASKWSATLQLALRKDIPPRHFGEFLDDVGGVEGAAAEWARLKRDRINP